MKYNNIDFNNKTILITGGAGFIGSNIAFYLQENYPDSRVIIFDCFRNNEVLSNGNPSSYGHYKNLIGFKGDVICGNINIKNELSILDNYKFDSLLYISSGRIYYNMNSTLEENYFSVNPNLKNDLYNISKLQGESLCLSMNNPKIKIIGSGGTKGIPEDFRKSILFNLRTYTKRLLLEALA